MATRHSQNDPARGARLTAAMIASGCMFNCQLSYDLGVTESSLSRWRSGGPMSVALAQRLGLSIDWLITGRETLDQAPKPPRDPLLSEITSLFAALPPADRALVLSLNRALISRRRPSADLSADTPA